MGSIKLMIAKWMVVSNLLLQWFHCDFAFIFYIVDFPIQRKTKRAYCTELREEKNALCLKLMLHSIFLHSKWFSKSAQNWSHLKEKTRCSLRTGRNQSIIDSLCRTVMSIFWLIIADTCLIFFVKIKFYFLSAWIKFHMTEWAYTLAYSFIYYLVVVLVREEEEEGMHIAVKCWQCMREKEKETNLRKHHRHLLFSFHFTDTLIQGRENASHERWMLKSKWQGHPPANSKFHFIYHLLRLFPLL